MNFFRYLKKLMVCCSLMAVICFCSSQACLAESHNSGHVTSTFKKESRNPEMSLGKAIILGLVEGATEYLPFSSTGHLCLAQRLMGLGQQQEDKGIANAYAICIQAGAILAVLGLYRRRMVQMTRGLMGRDASGLKLSRNLAIALSRLLSQV